MGKVKLHSPDHIALLVHNTFNVSIPREHIPSSQWEFQHGPAENDPEFGAGANEGEKTGTWGGWADVDEWGKTGEWGATVEEQKREEEVDENSEDVSLGAWVDSFTGERLGGSSRVMKFTVIG